MRAIEDSVELKNVHEMRVFLGMTNYQRKFVEGYSKVTSTLTDLLKKHKRWSWMDKCQTTLDNLKKWMVTTPILKLPNFKRPFEVHNDASDFSIGGVLMQDGHSVAYESQKLEDRERRYLVHEKEMIAIIHYLHVWRHYLIGKLFVVNTNNVAASYFASQSNISAKQARWRDFLVEFDMTIEYRLGRHNAVANALSRKGQHVALEGEGQQLGVGVKFRCQKICRIRSRKVLKPILWRII